MQARAQVFEVASRRSLRRAVGNINNYMYCEKEKRKTQCPSETEWRACTRHSSTCFTRASHVCIRAHSSRRMSSCDVESVLRVCLVRPGARLPARASAGAAGYDLARYSCRRDTCNIHMLRKPGQIFFHFCGFFCHSAVDAVIPAGGQLLIALGIKINIPTGHYGRIAPRSGLSVKNRIHVGAGVVGTCTVVLLGKQ